MFSVSGAMKSFSSEVKASEERLFRYALPNATHLAAPPVRASKSTCASPNVRGLIGPVVASPSDSLTGIGEVLIDPVASPVAVRSTFLFQHGSEFAASQSAAVAPSEPSIQRERNRIGLVPPLDRSYWISKSPDVRTGVTPLPEMTLDWLNSKSMFVVPCGSCTRCQNRFRNRPSGFVSR